MHDSNLPDHSCRLRRRSSASRAIPANDLESILDIAREPRRRVKSQSAFTEHHEQLSAIAALQLRFSELAPRPKQALELIAHEALAITNAQGTAIAIASGQAVVCCARAGDLGPPLGTPIKTRSGLSGECLSSGEVVCCDDTETDPRVDGAICRQSGIRSVLGIPLRLNDQVVGILEVFSDRLAAFGYCEARLLQLLADLVSEPPILGASPGNLSEIKLHLPATIVRTPPTQDSTVERANPPAVTNAKTLDSGWRSGNLTSGRWAPARSRHISKCLETIRQDPALRLLGRAKAYLTIEALHDGTDRSCPIELFEELMFQRAAEIGLDLNSATSS